MTDQQVRDEAMTLFMAGHETTAMALSWTWYLLAQHPEVDARLGEELAPCSASARPPRPTCRDLAYPRWSSTKSMRLYPPAYAIGRQAARPTEVAGHPLPRGRHRDHAGVGGASRPPLVRGPRGVPPRALGRRPRPPAAALRLLPLRRRAAPVHRQRVRDDGSRPASWPRSPSASGSRWSPASA